MQPNRSCDSYLCVICRTKAEQATEDHAYDVIAEGHGHEGVDDQVYYESAAPPVVAKERKEGFYMSKCAAYEPTSVLVA